MRIGPLKLKNWCFWTVLLEKTLESPVHSKESKSVNLKATLNIHWKDWCWSWSSNTLATWCKELSHWKICAAGKGWRQEEMGTTKDEMIGWHHWFNGHEFQQTPGDSEGQESLACYSSWGCRESDMTEQLNNNKILSVVPVSFLEINQYQPVLLFLKLYYDFYYNEFFIVH